MDKTKEKLVGSERPTGGMREWLFRITAAVGPGLFILGYTIGTGSVTTMATSGARFGLALWWAVAFSCFFTFILIVAVSRSTIVRGETLIQSIRRRFNRPLALFFVLALLLTVVSSIMGVVAIVADLLEAWSAQWMPGRQGVPSIVTALFLSALLYVLFWTGNHAIFLKVMAGIVAVMAVCFLLTTIAVISEPEAVASTLVPVVPVGGDGLLVMAGMVGTTMASVVIVARSYLIDEQGWGLDDLRVERRDAAFSLTLTFVVSAAIMASAAGTLYLRGLRVDNAIDMVLTLEPLAGRFAAAIFMAGIFAAALSSIFPNYVLGPWLILDYQGKSRDLSLPWVRVFVLLVAATGLTVPLFGGRPVLIMIASQAISPVVMPLLIICLFILLNDSNAEYRNPKWLNLGLIVALIFSLLVSYAAVVGLINFLTNG